MSAGNLPFTCSLIFSQIFCVLDFDCSVFSLSLMDEKKILSFSMTSFGSVTLFPSIRSSFGTFEVVVLTLSNMKISETSGPIKAKFCVEPLWVRGTKFCSRHLGHMTKMAATSIYGKTFQRFSSLEPAGRFQRNLV